MHLLVLLLTITSVLGNNWATYPQVPKTASINGFADPIYDLLPKCAQKCVKASTSNTPCPYWDTGCFCVMPQWAGLVGQCFALECKGKDVVSATSLAYSLCSRVGANIWLMPASITEALSSAAGTFNEAAPSATNTDFAYLLSESYTGTGASDNVKETGKASSKSESKSEAKSSETSSSGSSSAGSSSAGSSSASGSSSAGDGVTAGVGLTVLLGTLLSMIM